MSFYYRHSPGNPFIDIDSNKPVENPDVLERIRQLRIPPSYRQVKISNNPFMPRQATGLDSTGRVQSFYLRQTLEENCARKFCRLGTHYPVISSNSDNPFQLPPTTHPDTLLAIEIIHRCSIRPGKIGNSTYGAATLLRRHIRHLTHDTVTISFIGKANVLNTCRVTNSPGFASRIAAAMQRSESDRLLPHTSAHIINALLTEYHGITAKDIRTWNANVVFWHHMQHHRSQKDALKAAAAAIHNSWKVCRDNYIAPQLLSFVDPNLSLRELLTESCL
jgi:DNA topoisomerase IB